MKKLNNKGLSIIELLVCFVIVAIISIALINTIMNYRAKQETENIKNLIRTYKNTITKVVQNDIINYGLKSAEVDETEQNTIKIKLNFLTPIDTQNTLQKELIIVANNDENYIEYPDTIKISDTEYKNQNVKYDLPSTTKIHIQKGNSEQETKNDIHFTLETPLIDTDTFYLHIPIEHSEIDKTYGITIVAPFIKED